MTTTTVEAVGNNEIDVISFSAYCGLVAAYDPSIYDPNVRPKEMVYTTKVRIIIVSQFFFNIHFLRCIVKRLVCN